MKSKLSKLLNRQISSTLVWILVIFIVLDVSLLAIQPLKFINDWKLLPLKYNPILSKIPKFLDSKSNPEIVILGSSLPMMAVAKWDEAYCKSVNTSTIKNVWQYDRAMYLQDTLKKNLHRKIKVANLTCVACMVSEAKSIMDRAVSVGKEPKVVIYGVGPRSFMDNTRSEYNTSPVTQIISQHKCVFDICKGNISYQEVRDMAFSCIWNFYKEKSDYRDFVVAYTCNLFDRSPTVYAAKQRTAAENASKFQKKDTSLECTPESKGEVDDQKLSYEERLAKDLAVYNVRYNPPNFEQFDKQFSEFKKLLELCKSKNILIYVVAMPITGENRNLLDKKLLARYETEIPEAINSIGGKFIKLDQDPAFSKADFDDSVHTNARGGKKVQDRIIENLLQNGL